MRKKPFVLFFLLLCISALALIPLSASAQTTRTTQAPQMGAHIDLIHAVPDLKHPVPLDYPCPGQAHASVGWLKTSQNVHRSCSTSLQSTGVSQQSVHPALIGPPNCSSGPYLLTVSGQSRWYASNASANVGSWVEYFWCPAPGYANGLNWAYGREYPLSGCTGLGSGNGWGANMKSSTGVVEPDGDPWTWFNNICAGSNYVQDYSQYGDGSLLWQVWMYGYSLTGYSWAISPTYA